MQLFLGKDALLFRSEDLVNESVIRCLVYVKDSTIKILFANLLIMRLNKYILIILDVDVIVGIKKYYIKENIF